MKGYDGLGSLKNRTALATFFGKKLRKDDRGILHEHFCRVPLNAGPIYNYSQQRKGKIAPENGEKGGLDGQRGARRDRGGEESHGKDLLTV